MKRILLLAGLALGLLVLAFWAVQQSLDHRPPLSSPPSSTPDSSRDANERTHPGFQVGRILTVDGASFEGRLRWGGGQEAFWGDFMNGAKAENRWAKLVAPERLPKQRYPFSVFGVEVFQRERPMNLDRLFLARFGDLARIDTQGRDVRVTFKSGTVVELDRFEASDFDDGVRVWDETGGVKDLDSLCMRSIEFLPTIWRGQAPARLYGTVTTAHGEFSGFLQWNREKGLETDELVGSAGGNRISFRFDTLSSVARRGEDGMLVTLRDGREVVISGKDNPMGQRGVYVDEPRYGRVLVSWRAVQSVVFAAASDSGPAYREFPAGRTLSGTVTTRDGGQLAGRLVFDLDESETTETLDAPFQGVDYTLPFSLVRSIELPVGEQPARVSLTSGELLALERGGDLGATNLGMLVFVGGSEQPEYVPWAEVARVDFDRN